MEIPFFQPLLSKYVTKVTSYEWYIILMSNIPLMRTNYLDGISFQFNARSGSLEPVPYRGDNFSFQ